MRNIVVMSLWRIGASSFIASMTLRTGGQHLTFNVYEANWLFGDVRAVCCYGRYGVALVQHLIEGEDVFGNGSGIGPRLR